MDWEEAETKITEQLASMTKTMESLKKQVDGAETLVQKHNSEFGSARKEIQETAKSLQDILAKIPTSDAKEGGEKSDDEVKKLLDRVEKLEQSGGRRMEKGSGDGAGSPEAEGLKMLEALTAEQIDVAAAAYDQLVLDDRANNRKEADRLWKDPEAMRQFCARAKETVPGKPEGLKDLLQRAKSGIKKDPTEQFRALFEGLKKRDSVVPGAVRTAPSDFGGRRGEGGQDVKTYRRLVDGKLPLPESLRRVPK